MQKIKVMLKSLAAREQEFIAYTCLIGMADSAGCNASGVEETIEHLLCYCPAFENERRDLRTAIDQLDRKPFYIAQDLGTMASHIAATQCHKNAAATSENYWLE